MTAAASAAVTAAVTCWRCCCSRVLLCVRQLLRDERVLFAGYRMPHPLEHVMHIKYVCHARTPTPLRCANARLTD